MLALDLNNNNTHIDIYDVSRNKEIDIVTNLANKIWNEHFVAIISQDQINYMLKKYQSEIPIKKQILSGYKYYLIKYQHEYIGYFSINVDKQKRETHLSKIYILKHFRRLGIAKAAINFIEEYSLSLGIKNIWLVVNKNNSLAINAYTHLGYKISEEIVKDIGNGFVMDDYKMIKNI